MDNEYGLMFPIIIESTPGPEPGTSVSGPAKPGLLDAIESSIRIIIAYDMGERNFLFPFGTILRSLIGEPNAPPAKQAISLFVIKAIERWEQRLTEVDSQVEQIHEFVSIEIEGEIKEKEQ